MIGELEELILADNEYNFLKNRIGHFVTIGLITRHIQTDKLIDSACEELGFLCYKKITKFMSEGRKWTDEKITREEIRLAILQAKEDMIKRTTFEFQPYKGIKEYVIREYSYLTYSQIIQVLNIYIAYSDMCSEYYYEHMHMLTMYKLENEL